jgi:hypothetical protein
MEGNSTERSLPDSVTGGLPFERVDGNGVVDRVVAKIMELSNNSLQRGPSDVGNRVEINDGGLDDSVRGFLREEIGRIFECAVVGDLSIGQVEAVARVMEPTVTFFRGTGSSWVRSIRTGGRDRVLSALGRSMEVDGKPEAHEI